jgi:hypothetical protein
MGSSARAQAKVTAAMLRNAASQRREAEERIKGPLP